MTPLPVLALAEEKNMNRTGIEGDTQTCSAVVSICAATIPNSSRTAPAKSVFMCIFITGVVGSGGDTKKIK